MLGLYVDVVSLGEVVDFFFKGVLGFLNKGGRYGRDAEINFYLVFVCVVGIINFRKNYVK